MSDAIEGLQPELFWRSFAEIARIPRPSGREKAIGDFILERVKQLGLPAQRDAFGNVVVRKPASPGRENNRGICLQCHLDMVCEKNADKQHDFLKDPIELVRDGNLLRANGTTLGADNGVGVATALAVMADRTLQHGPMEFLFTVEEETGLAGARNLEPSLVKSRTLLNLDSEEEGALYVGCAGGKDTQGSWRLRREPPPADAVAVSVSVKGLKGGHSGLDIDKGLGNAIKLLNRAVLRLSEIGGRLCSIKGGNMRNAIPRECSAVLCLPQQKLEEAKQQVGELGSLLRAEFATVEPDLLLNLSALERGPDVQVFEPVLQGRICRTIAGLPNGVQHMSADIPRLVETSTNVAVISTTESNVILVTSQRSSVASRLAEVAESVEAVFKLGGADIEQSDGYPGWKPNLDSAILAVAKNCYRSLYGREIAVKAIHAGLECGIIGERVPGMDMISFGPTMEGAHSPDERLHIDSVGRFWEYLLEILKSVE